MRIPVCLPVLTVLTACTVVPPQAWTFDPTQPQPRLALPTADLAALTDRVAQLQLQRNEIRARIATEPDARKRQGHYAQLHSVGMELSPLERRLATVAAAR
jgi:hypothetical protein